VPTESFADPSVHGKPPVRARTPQIRACADRLPPELRTEFLRLLDEAGEFAARATQKRREAWGVYHSVVSPGGDHEREVPL
jgi:hypothetical protein